MRRPPVHLLITATALIGLAACQASTSVEPSAARGQLRPDAPPDAEYEVIGASPEMGPEGNSRGATRGYPSVTVEETEGLEAGEARAVLGPLRTRVLECLPNQSGAVTLRIVRFGDAIRINVRPGTSLNPLQQRCVLETLSTLNYDEALSRSTPGDRPAGFSTLLRIEF